MAKKIYVGSLSYDTTEETLNSTFAAIGPVVSAIIIKDKFTGHSKGFGFVEMQNDEDVQKAIDALNGTDLDGRTIRVNESIPQENNFHRGGFNNNRGGDNRGGDRPQRRW